MQHSRTLATSRSATSPAPSSTLSRASLIASWLAQIAAAAILGQTLFFKFAGAPEAKFIFTTLGVEPWGRIGAGITELITVALLLIPRTAIFGAALGVGLMLGAIGSHLTKLGIVVKDDGGLLFGLAIATLVLSTAILVLRRKEVLGLIAKLSGR